MGLVLLSMVVFMTCVFLLTTEGHATYSEGVKVFLDVSLDIAIWSVWGSQVASLIIFIGLFIVMWYSLKRELKCPETLKCTDYYCDGCRGMRETLDSSFSKFLLFSVTFLAIFITRFGMFTYTLNDNYLSIHPGDWHFTPVWVLYTTYMTEIILIVQIFIIRKN